MEFGKDTPGLPIFAPVDRAVEKNRLYASIAPPDGKCLFPDRAISNDLSVCRLRTPGFGEESAELGTDQGIPRPAGQRLGRRVDVADPPIGTDGHQRIDMRLDQGTSVFPG